MQSPAQDSLVAQSVKNLPAVQETQVWSLGWEDPLEKEMATHSSILAWKISWTEESGGLQSMGSQRVGHDWATNPHLRGRAGIPTPRLTDNKAAALSTMLSFFMLVSSLSRLWLFVTPWTAAHQAPLSLRFSRQGYWSGLPFPSPGDLPNPGIEPGSPALQANSLPTELQGKLDMYILNCLKFQEAINACICKFWTDVEKLGKNYLSTKKTFYSKMIAWEKHFCKWMC